jgi:prepilin-type N-terminal cleavage/methylation domain-containing protein
MRIRGIKDARDGFSLVEMMVVVIVVGILIVASIPNIAQSNLQRRVESAASDMSARIQFARQHTVATRIPSRLVLDRNAGTYHFESQATDMSWFRSPDEDYPLPHGVHWSCIAGPDSNGNVVEFESRGTAALDDMPMSVVFNNDRGDSSFLSLVCTGRVTVR